MNLFPRRCHEGLSREPSPASAEIDREALADHLAVCPRCAAWAERDAALSRIWETTRPAEPTVAAWDAVWADVTSRLDGATKSDPAATVLPFPSRPWRRNAIGVLVAAQAAAVLAAVVLWSAHRRPADPAAPGPDSTRVALLQGAFDINPGELCSLREEDGGLHAIIVAQDDRTNAIDGYYPMLGFLESLAE